MQRLSKKQIESLKEFREKGLSLDKIHTKTNIPKSTIQYHVAKEEGIKRPRIIPINLPSSNFTKGELVGAFAGDGNYYHSTNGRSSQYLVRYYLSYKDDIDYSNHLFNILKNMGLNPHIYIKKYCGKPSAFQVEVSSKKYIEFIKCYLQWEGKKTYSVCLKKKLKDYDEEFLFGFARGLMDTDGFVSKPCTLGFGVVSKKLIDNLRDILLMININPKIRVSQRGGNRKDIYLLRIKKADFNKYIEKIGFSNPRKSVMLLELNKNGGVARI